MVSPVPAIENPGNTRRRRRVQLSSLPPVPVEFSGERAGEGPLTLGQLDVYQWMSLIPDHPYAVLCFELPVPAEATVGEVAGTVAALIARHESLRTRYVAGEPPRQQVAASGVQVVEVCSLGEGQWGPADRPVVADALVRWLRESPDPVRRPVRVVVAVAPGGGGRVIACAAGLTHLAVDHAAIEILKRDFAGLLGDPGRRPAGKPGHQPLDQAELEATPAEQRRGETALEHLGGQFRRAPRCLYALPGARPSGESLAVELSSVAAAMAVRLVAARTRASQSSIVLAAICTVLARRAGYPELVFPLVSSNRFERHLVSYVGALSQGCMVTITVTGWSFDELAGRTWATVLNASRHARYDIAGRDALHDLIAHERGLRLNFEPLFNNLANESWSRIIEGGGVRPEAVSLALAGTRLRWRPMPGIGSPVRFTLAQVDGCLRLEGWSGDTGLLPRGEVEGLLLAVERVLVAAAGGDVAESRMAGVIGLEPIGGADRVLVDCCWVEVADVRRLVAEAVAPGVAWVFASAGEHSLVAYVAASATVRTPRQAHARCMAALADHPTAITPRYYVICPAGPADPADPAAWPAPLAAGTGRGAKPAVH
ncbi:hypothetical protein J5X84_33790 [Streptosporangiaceae bacterium NEAU-GS5]|nr:hypothetical protein [Streptosporangiaceae bacterium NEAU-GS5]